MNHLSINSPNQSLNLQNWFLQGKDISESKKNIKQLKGVFADTEAYNLLNPDLPVYQVQAHLPVSEGTSGGLYFGTTIIQAGKVGIEYFMTRGHFHANADRTEYYWGVQGEGMLILMDKNRNTWAEKMFPGSLHFIPGFTAHRVANTGSTALIFGACWPSDAGHNYTEIEKNGFSARLFELKEIPTLVNI